jgi:hypothetical protein
VIRSPERALVGAARAFKADDALTKEGELMSRRRSVRVLLGEVITAAALALVFATSALAAPSVPILKFTDLRTDLLAAPNHQLNGYMKTVVSGSDIATIPLTVVGVPLTGGADDDLIMFEATGTLIQKYGGIVAGMSGSPIYVNDGTGVEKLVGAVSYGDYFTLGGTGLATPIEAMTHIEENYSTAAPLSSPVITSNGLFNRIIVAPDPQHYAGAAKAGAFVATPLSSVFIGGLKPSSAGYKALAKDLTARGIRVVSLDSPLAGEGGDNTQFSTEMTAGASVAAMVSRGDMWVGGLGTVTYANNGNVLAFGHPAYWAGTTSLYLSNAWIEGVWPNSYEPYKVGEPGTVRGTVTQDRDSGILGKLGLYPAETTITASALDVGTGKETTSAVYIPRSLISHGVADSSLVSVAAYIAGSELFDQRMQPGSAHSTATVTVRDGDTTRTVVLANYSSSSSDIASAVDYDVATAISTLQSVLAYGVDDLEIVSVNLTGEYSARRTDAQIVKVDAPNGLHVGANRIRVDALVYGIVATQTVETTLTIPAGTPLDGTLAAQAASYASDNSMSLGDMGSSFSRKTIAGLVAQLNATLPDTTMLVTYQPTSSSSSGSTDNTDDSNDQIDSPSTTLSTITTQLLAPWPVSGQARSYATIIDALVMPNPISYAGFADGIVGEIDGPSAATVVSLYSTTAGSSTESLVATTTATSYGGVLVFEIPLMRTFTTNTSFRVHVDGGDTWSGADATVKLGVQAIASLSSSASSIKKGKSVTLKASVYPNTAAGGTVVFERLSGKKWIKISSKTLTVSGSNAVASISWKPGKGKYKVRARYLGGTYNAATTTGTRTITVK